MSVAVAVQGQGWEHGYGDGWNGESATPHMGWRSWNSFGACISAGIPGDQSNCSFPKENSGQGQGVGSRHACKTCGTIASAIDGVTVRKWKVAGKTISLADVGCKNGHQRPGWHGCGPMHRLSAPCPRFGVNLPALCAGNADPYNASAL